MKRRNFLLSLTALGAMTACGSPQGAQSYQIPQPQPGQGLIVLYRPASAVAAVLQMPITVDGTPIGSLANGAILTRNLAPGQYLVQTTAPSVDGVSNVSVTLAAGETVFIRGETALGWPTGRAKLVPVSAEQGRSEVGRL